VGEIEACYGRPVGTVVAVADEVIAALGSESAGSAATAGTSGLASTEAIGAKVNVEPGNVDVVAAGADVASAGAAGAGDPHWMFPDPSWRFQTGHPAT
jgi:hypothetical protein